jgi:hypothetical protein
MGLKNLSLNDPCTSDRVASDVRRWIEGAWIFLKNSAS